MNGGDIAGVALSCGDRYSGDEHQGESMADTPTCRKCGVALTSTHVVLRVCYEGGSPFKNTATRRLAATYGVPEEIRACLDCGVAIGQSLQADDPQE